MSYDTGIANRLRSAGIRVVECAGWQSRGSSSFSPRGSVNHHTAGPASGATPSLNTCINGRSDLPGPLCNVMQSREPDGRDIAYVVAAGKANHAGEGGWKGLSGNSSVYGLEIEHTGTAPLPMGRQQIAAAIHAAMFTGDPGYVCQHREWTSRKIDAAEDVDANGFRAMVANPSKGDVDMPLNEEDKTVIRNILRQELYGDDNAHAKGMTPIIRKEVRAIVEAMMNEAGGVVRSESRELAKLGAEDAGPKVAEDVIGALGEVPPTDA